MSGIRPQFPAYRKEYAAGTKVPISYADIVICLEHLKLTTQYLLGMTVNMIDGIIDGFEFDEGTSTYAGYGLVVLGGNLYLYNGDDLAVGKYICPDTDTNAINNKFSDGLNYPLFTEKRAKAVDVAPSGNWFRLDATGTKDLRFNIKLALQNATEDLYGKVKLATAAEVAASGSGSNVVTVNTLKSGKASNAEVLAGTVDTRFITPAGLKYYNDTYNGGLITKKIDIGAWNMPLSLIKTVALPTNIAGEKFISAEAYIFNDDLQGGVPIDGYYPTGGQGGYTPVGSVYGPTGEIFQIYLEALSTSIFNTSAYSSTSNSRGYILIKHLL